MLRKVCARRDDGQMELDCYHLLPVGTPGDVAAHIDCTQCDALLFPAGLNSYKRTPTFTDGTVPKGLLNNHSTRAGVWGEINVLSGKLRYAIPSQNRELLLVPGTTGHIPPQLVHHVTPDGPVEFFVAFFRKEKASD